ncbi:MAG: cytochrome c family protein [Rhizobiaceae bacterium]|nr:cytochrome c family protein [Rhizobiaceae bacterium]
MAKFIKFLIPALIAGSLAVLADSAFALDGDAEKGEAVFKKCKSCHMVGDDAQNRVGPVLNNVFGRQAGTFADYKYGKSIVDAGEDGLVWNDEEMFEYLADPKKYLRAKLDDKKAKSKMSFKLKKEDERANVIAYLKSFSPESESEVPESNTEEESSSN